MALKNHFNVSANQNSGNFPAVARLVTANPIPQADPLASRMQNFGQNLPGPGPIEVNLSRQQRVTAIGGLPNDLFGTSVAIGTDVAVIGAPALVAGAKSSAGAAYVFVRTSTGWSFQQKLTAFDGALNDRFGASVALTGTTIAVSATNAEVGANLDQGAVYIFERNSNGIWTLQTRLSTVDGNSGDLFGSSIALAANGNTALVGTAAAKTTFNGRPGAAYVFTRINGNWSQQAKLTATDGATGDGFGTSVALDIDGNTALIGSPNADNFSNLDQGAAYFFTRLGNSWTQRIRIAATDGAAGDQFGGAVAVEGGTALIGAAGADLGISQNQGAAYIFTGSAAFWSQQQKLTVSDGAANDGFGNAVALNQSTAVIGAVGDDLGVNQNQGAAYVFNRNSTGWTTQQKLMATDGTAFDRFGSSVAVTGNVVVVGVENDDVDANADQGSAYVFSSDAATSSLNLSATAGTSQSTRVNTAFPTNLQVRALVGTLPQPDVTVTFSVKSANGAGAVFSGGFQSTAVNTNASGFATAPTLTANGTVGNYTVTAAVNSPSFGSATVTFFLANTCNTTVSLSPGTLPNGTLGVFYSQSLTVFPSGSYTFAVAAGALPAGLSLNPSTGVISGTPTGGGSSTFTIAASTAGGCAGSQTFTVAIQGAAPSIIPANPVTLQQGNMATSVVLATITDGQLQTASLSNPPNGITFSQFSTINGTVTATITVGCSATVGSNNVTLTASGLNGVTRTAIFTVNVTANTAPRLGVYPSRLFTPGTQITLTPTTAPSDNGPLASVVVMAPTGYTGALTINQTTGVVTTTPNTSGTFTFTVRATDNCGLQTDRMFVLTTEQPDKSPQIVDLSPRSGVTGATVVISGLNLSSVTGVQFGGQRASFVINSVNQITTTVPSGARTGPVTVTSTSGTSSGPVFTVTSTGRN